MRPSPATAVTSGTRDTYLEWRPPWWPGVAIRDKAVGAERLRVVWCARMSRPFIKEKTGVVLTIAGAGRRPAQRAFGDGRSAPHKAELDNSAGGELPQSCPPFYSGTCVVALRLVGWLAP